MLADEKPVAWNQRCGFKAKPIVPLYTHPAPAAPQAEQKREPNPDEVICPACTHQFRAIPVNVQAQLAQREPLSEKQIDAIHELWYERAGMSFADVVRAVERAHGIIGGSDAD